MTAPHPLWEVDREVGPALAALRERCQAHDLGTDRPVLLLPLVEQLVAALEPVLLRLVEQRDRALRFASTDPAPETYRRARPHSILVEYNLDGQATASCTRWDAHGQHWWDAGDLHQQGPRLYSCPGVTAWPPAPGSAAVAAPPPPTTAPCPRIVGHGEHTWTHPQVLPGGAEPGPGSHVVWTCPGTPTFLPDADEPTVVRKYPVELPVVAVGPPGGPVEVVRVVGPTGPTARPVLADGDPCPLTCRGTVYLDHEGTLVCNNCTWNSEEDG